MPQDEDIYTIQQRSMKNEDNIRALNVSLNALADKTKQDIDNLDNAIDDDNIQRDRNISEINNNLALLKLFVIEKLSNHPNDYVDFINHLASQPINDSDANSVMSDTASDISTPAASSYASSVMSDYASDISPAPSSYAGSVASDDSFTGGRRIKRKGTRKKKRHKSKRKSKRKYK